MVLLMANKEYNRKSCDNTMIVSSLELLKSFPNSYCGKIFTAIWLHVNLKNINYFL